MTQYSARVQLVIDAMTRYFENVPDQVRRRKLVLWILFGAVTVFAFMGLGRVKFDMTIEGWFEKDDPTLVALEGFRTQFGSEDNLYIIYRPKDGNVFSAKSLAVAKAIREDLLNRRLALKDDEPSALRRIVKITALTNAPVLRAEGDALISRPLTGHTLPATPEELEELRRLAESQETFPKLYFSRDGKYGAIHVETDFGTIPMDAEPSGAPGSRPDAGRSIDNLSMEFDATEASDAPMRFKPTDLAEYYDFIQAVKVTLEKPEFAEHFDYFPVGNAASTEYDMKVLEEMGLLYLGMLIIMVAVLWFLFRSLSGVLWPILIVVLSCIWTIGFTGWLGYTVTAFLILTVVMILVVGIADVIHVLSGYLYFKNKGKDHREALRSAFRTAANPSFLTTVTTGVAMLSVVFTPIVPIKIFGVMTAVGIALAFLFTIYWMPLMLDLWWAPAKRRDVAAETRKGFSIGRWVPDFSLVMQRVLRSILPFTQRNKYAITLFSAAVLGICVYGGLQVRVDTDAIAQYPKDSPIRENFKIADREMIGSQVLEIYLDLKTEYAFQDPQVLMRLDRLQDTIENNYSKYVVRTASLVDVAKKSYQTLNEDRPEMYRIPPTPQLLSQTLFMFDNANSADRRKMVSDDYSRAHITVYLRNAGSYEYTKIFDDMRQDIDAAVESLRGKYPDARASITGMFTLMMQGSDYLSWTSLSSFGMAVITISVILLVMFGSFQAGLISIISNAVPATLSFGLMGLLDIPMDFTTVLIAPIIVGISVDDTIHFISHYRNEVCKDGNVERALQHTVEEVGQAVTFTSLILGLGLSILAFSSSVGNANVGLFGSLAVFTGLFCELLLLPALVLIFKLRFQTPHTVQATMPEHA
jgi:predicted RND superfamily exporter protein